MMSAPQMSATQAAGAPPDAQLTHMGIFVSDLDTMVAETIRLPDINEAFDKLRKGDSVRSVIEFA